MQRRTFSPKLAGRFYLRSCGLKRRYASRAEAEEGNNDQVYHCTLCGTWHRTTKPRKKGK